MKDTHLQRMLLGLAEEATKRAHEVGRIERENYLLFATIVRECQEVACPNHVVLASDEHDCCGNASYCPKVQRTIRAEES